MPLDGDRAWRREDVISGDRVRTLVESIDPLRERAWEPHATARTFEFADGKGEIGFINPVSEPFCADCSRLRLTADGKLRTCLFSNTRPISGGRCGEVPTTERCAT
jgi:cyclic pyranopterin phosphate synthase